MKTKTQTNEIGLSEEQIERLKTLTIEDVEQRKREHLNRLKSTSKKDLVQLVLSLERVVGQKNGFLVDLRNLVEEMHGEIDFFFDDEFSQILLKESELTEQESQSVALVIDDIASNYTEE